MHVYYYKDDGPVLLFKAFLGIETGFCRLLPRMDVDWTWKRWTNFSKFKSCAGKKYQKLLWLLLLDEVSLISSSWFATWLFSEEHFV